MDNLLLRERIGEAIHAFRIEREETLRDVSMRSYMSLGYLSELERGVKDPSSEMLSVICAALDVSLDDLLFKLLTQQRVRELTNV
jgi:transcriptional regulator with XRE-family HTH domain